MGCPYATCSVCSDAYRPDYWNWSDNGNSTMVDWFGYLFDKDRSFQVHMFSATYLCSGKKNKNEVSMGKIVQVVGSL